MKLVGLTLTTPMVHGVRERRKTNTRRKIQYKYSDTTIEWKEIRSCKEKILVEIAPKVEPIKTGHNTYKHNLRLYSEKIPPLQVGDCVWVREEHYAEGHWEIVPGKKTKAGKDKWRFVDDGDHVLYYNNAPKEFRRSMDKKNPGKTQWYKRLARFMFQHDSRHKLLITHVSPEKLEEITEADILKEGIIKISKDNGRTWKYGLPDKDGLPGGCDIGWPWHEYTNTPQEAFIKLWEQVHGIGTYNAQTWVWKYEFELIK